MSFWRDVKEFWSSQAVRVSITIFLSIIALMAAIVLVSTLVGCRGSNWYTKVDNPTIIVKNVGRLGNISQAYLIVVNPTSQRKHFNVRCCMSSDQTECIDTYVVVPARSDKRVRIGTLTALKCSLEKDLEPGSVR